MVNINGCSPMITNSIIWNNGSSEVLNNNGTPIFKNSIIKDSGGSGSWNTAYGTDNGDNLDTDPLFVNAVSGDYTLQGCSPAIDTGDNAAWTTTTLITDIAGNTRPFNSTVDIGAYEYQGIPIAISIAAPTVTQPTCAVPSGTIVVNATTTSGTLEYSIDNGSTYQASATFSGLSGGSYTITVREQGSSCTETYGSNPVVINTPVILTIAAPTVTQPTCAVPSGTIVVNATTTSGTLEYSVDNGSTYQTESTFSGLSGGSYTITVREQSSVCEKTYASNPVAINILLSYTEIYVNKTATGNNNGTSWTDAFTDLQDAIDASCSNVEIWVAAGTYYPTSSPDGTTTDPRDKAFHLGTDMKIYGGFVGGETQLSARNAAANVTILSGDFNNDDVVTGGGSTLSFSGNAENAYHVMLTADLTAAAVIDGFTIEGGNADGSGTISYQSISFYRNYGGGMGNYSSSSTITNSTFANNSASQGGGMYNYDSSPNITNSTFANNSAIYGGGMFNYDSSPIITNTAFTNNNAYDNGGGMFNQSSSSPTIMNSTFANNNGFFGGGMYNDNSSPTITNSTIENNSASQGGGGK
jgi:hypothetical protein